MRVQRQERLKRRRGLLSRIRRLSLAKVAVLLLVGGFMSFVFLVAWYSRSLPEPGRVQRSSGFSTVFLDRDGKVLFEMFEDKNRIPVDLEEIPDHVRQATIAIEDKNFYSHPGFSVWGMVRAMFNTLIKRRLEGGSTLTQQLVKNVLLTRERTINRKIKEFILALELERRYGKDEILELYLNEAPYGGTFWGIASAAQGYFGKDVGELTLAEAAVLAGLPQRPTYYSPIIGKERAYIGRAKDVLRRMREDDYITKEEELKATKQVENMKIKKSNLAIRAPHFVFYVRKLISEQFGEKILDQGIEITTTLDLDLQEQAQKIVFDEIEKTKALKATNGSVIVLDNKTGQILSMVGSYDYTDEDYGRFNTTTALRQPGSAIKPITYATAFTQGYTPATLVMDVPTEFPDQGDKNYNPVNYDGKFRGPIQLRFALGNSINVPAVKVLALVGIRNFLTQASSMGLETLAPTDANLKRFGLSLTLGGGETRLIELTSAYSVFGRGGTRIDPIAILEIKDHKGKSLFKAKKTTEKRVLSKEVSFLISHILSDNVARALAFGTNSKLVVPGKTVAVKTGTTNDKRDNWAVGFTRSVTVGSWVGNNDNSPMDPKIASGLTGASTIWNKVMRAALKDRSDGIMSKPDDVEALEIDAFLGGLPKDGYPTRSEYFIKGTEPTSISPFYKKIKVSRSNPDKLANEVEIKKGDYDEREFIVITESDPVSTDGKNRWQEAIDAWAQQQDAKFKVPRSVSGAATEDVFVTIREPKNKSRVESNDVRVRAQIASVKPIVKVQLFVNDTETKVYTGNKKDIDEMLNLPDGQYKIGIKVENEEGRIGEAGVEFGVNEDWQAKPTPTP